MRILAIILTILVFHSCKTGKSEYNIKSNSNDTIFIEKDKRLGGKQSIYFEQNENSKTYNELSNFDFDRFEKETYNNSIQNLKNKEIKLKTTKPIISQTEWIPLRSYKGKLYVYKPCDFYSYYKISINDSTLIDWTGEGAIANKIVRQKKINNLKYEFEIQNYQKRNLEINILDLNKGIAIFKNTESNQSESYLMVDVKKIKLFPLIVNNCEMNKQSELEFDNIDFEKLKNDYR